MLTSKGEQHGGEPAAQQAQAQKALKEQVEARVERRPANSLSSNEGMISKPREDYPPSGAFDAEGREPALRRSRER